METGGDSGQFFFKSCFWRLKKFQSIFKLKDVIMELQDYNF